MISYFNYEINNNLNNIHKTKLVNNKIVSKLHKKYNENINNKGNFVKSLPKDVLPLLFLDNKINDQLKETCDYEKIKDVFIHIVYQYKYKNNKIVTGFGDFVRSIYFALQFSEKYGCNIEININKHNIKKYLEKFCKTMDLSNFIGDNVVFYDNANYDAYLKINNIINYKYINTDVALINYINNLINYENHKYVYLINHPDKKLITNSHKQFVKKLIKPINELNNLVSQLLLNLNLKPYYFITIHIRYYDESTENTNDVFVSKMNYVIKIVNEIKKRTNVDILMITSNNFIKQYLIKYIPYIKTHFNSICHTRDNETDEKIVNTLKDFYAMSYSNYIYSFSVYDHGSGFSEWCATTYNIPYICYFIP